MRTSDLFDRPRQTDISTWLEGVIKAGIEFNRSKHSMIRGTKIMSIELVDDTVRVRLADDSRIDILPEHWVPRGYFG